MTVDGGRGGGGVGRGADGAWKPRQKGSRWWQVLTATGMGVAVTNVGSGAGGDVHGGGGLGDYRQPRGRQQPGVARPTAVGAQKTVGSAVGGVRKAAIDVRGWLERFRRRLGRPRALPEERTPAGRCGDGGGASAHRHWPLMPRVVAGAATSQPDQGLTRDPLTPPRL